MIVTQEFLDAMKEYNVVGRTWYDLNLGDSLNYLGWTSGYMKFYCETKALHIYLPIDLVEEFINVV